MAPLGRLEMIDDLEARRLPEIVDGGEVDEEVESQLGIVA
jgi:hypothetical protein